MPRVGIEGSARLASGDQGERTPVDYEFLIQSAPGDVPWLAVCAQTEKWTRSRWGCVLVGDRGEGTAGDRGEDSPVGDEVLLSACRLARVFGMLRDG